LPDTDPRSPNFTGLKPPVPKWHDLKMSPNSPVTGQILCSFDVCEADTEFEVPTTVYNLSKYIKMNQICFEIQVLGLRRL